MTASEKYKSNRQEIDKLIALIQNGLKEFDSDQADNPKDWGFVGNTDSVIENLAYVAYCIGGINTRQLKALTREP
jgi:hypothetical protein